MGLQLFHESGYAQSMLSPQAQRGARHPALLLMMASLWLAAVGNFPLWRELARLPMDGSQLLGIGLYFTLLTTGALGALLSALNWPWLLRTVIIVLLWLNALNSVLLWSGHGALRLSMEPAAWQTTRTELSTVPLWQSLLVFGLLALAPTLWLWRLRLRRLALMQRVPQNLLLLLLYTAALTLVWLGSRETLLPLLQDQPRWLELLNPVNTLLSLRH